MREGDDGRAEPEFVGHLARRERRAWLFVALGSLAAASGGLWLAPAAPLPWPLPLLGAAALLPFVGGRRARRVRVSAGPGWLAFDEGRRRAIAAGHLRVDLRGEATLRLRPGGRAAAAIELGADDAEQGRRLLRALRLDAAHASAAFRVIAGSAQALGRDAALAAGAAAALVAGLAGVRMLHLFAPSWGLIGLCLALLPASALVLGAWLRRRQVRAEIGLDGVATRSAYGRRAHYPFERVAAIVDGRLEVVLNERSGGRVPFAAKQLGDFEAFAQRLVEAFALYRAAAAEGEGWKVLLPAEGASSVAWLARLRALGAGGAQGYRALGLERARLLAMAEAPAVPPLGRAAAAFVLFERVTPAELERLRVAAETSAFPGLRAALFSVVRGDRELSARAMGELRATASGAWGELSAGKRR